MIAGLAKSIFGSSNDRYVAKLGKTVEAINAFEPTIAALSDEELANQTVVFRQRLADGAKLDDLLPEAFATVREAAKRTLGQRHYDVQMIGGIALHRGEIAEMRTGEGKTLVATLAVYLNALPGKGVHVVTVNDYLAKRDAEWMGQVYKFLGLSVGIIVPNLIDHLRRDAYNCDITYATNNELGFDYLRDNMKYSRDQMVQRPFNFAIVDEVDSILIDEARTPLIISGPTDDKSELYVGVDAIVKQFVDADYELDEKQKSVVLTEEGTEKAERMLEDAGLIEGQNLYDIANTQTVHHLNQSLKANKHVQEGHRLHRQGRQGRHHRRIHRPDDGRAALVGRAPPGGRSQGRRADRAREPDAGVDHLPELFPHVSQVVGDDRHGADRSARILRHLQDERGVDPDQCRRQADRRGRRILQEYHRQVPAPSPRKSASGRTSASRCWSAPSSIEKSEMLSEYLEQQGINHEVLNARFHESEAHIVAQAGSMGAVTIATNMAGRGTDIQLGGNVEFRIEDELEATCPRGPNATPRSSGSRPKSPSRRPAVLEAGGLFVLGTERHESRRIDNQLRGRSGRQGDPGLSRFYLSLDDDLLRIFGPQTAFSAADEQESRGWRGDRLPVDFQGDRDRPAQGRGAQLRHSQAGRRIRRRHERPAQGDLRAARRDHGCRTMSAT